MLVYQRVSLSESRSLSLLDHLEIARKLWTFWNPNSWNAALVIVTHRFCTITYHVHIRNTTWRNTTLLMTTVVRLDMNRYRHIMMSRQIFLPFTRNMFSCVNWNPWRIWRIPFRVFPGFADDFPTFHGKSSGNQMRIPMDRIQELSSLQKHHLASGDEDVMALHLLLERSKMDAGGTPFFFVFFKCVSGKMEFFETPQSRTLNAV